MSVKKLEPIFDFLGEVLALIMVAVYILTLADAQWGFFAKWDPVILDVMAILRLYGSLLLVGIVGMEAVSKRKMLVRWIFYAAVAIIVIFLFFPATYQNLLNML